MVTKGQVHLLEYRKMTYAGLKAVRTKGVKTRKEAAQKAWKTTKHTSQNNM